MTNKETTDWLGLRFYYDGYIQVTPTYRMPNGMYALQGTFVYKVPGDAEQVFRTAAATNTTSSPVLRRSARVYDNYFDWSNKTTFNYNFAWGAENAGGHSAQKPNR